jgi:chromosome partitioning protein
MNTLAVVAQKGGAGKTTFAVHMAVYASMQGLRVAIIDLDPQESAFDWNASRPTEKQFSAVKCDAASLPNVLEKAQTGGIDLCIIDTAPHSDSEAAAAAKVADFVLIPCRPQRFDLKATAKTIHIVQLTKTPFAVVLNCTPQGFRLAEEARAILQSASGVTVLSTLVHQQVAMAYAVLDARSVHEYDPECRAADEIAEVYDHIAKALDLQPNVETPAKARQIASRSDTVTV